MTEFKKTGAFYVSQWNGNPANAGSNVSPYAHPTTAPSSTANIIVVGTGYYKGLWSGTRRLLGDGKVIFDMEGQTLPSTTFTGAMYENIHFKNGGLGGIFGSVDCIYDLTLGVLPFINTSACLRGIILSGSPIASASNPIFTNCIILRKVTTNVQIMSFSYIAGSGGIATVANSGIADNCINGTITVGGVDYESKRLFDGSTRPDSNPAIPDVIGVIPNFYTNRNFSTVDPKFTDLINRAVNPDSDLLKRSSVNGYIGGVKPSRFIGKTIIDPTLEIITSQINTADPSNWTIQAGNDEGFIYLTFKLSDNLIQVPIIHADSIFAFDGSVAGGTVGNNNVPDFFPTLYTPLSQAGLKPNRLTYRLRTSIRTNKPTAESHWDNDNLTLSTDVARYYVQEFGDQPRIANIFGVTYGAGSPEFPPATVKNTINARWCQIQIRLTNKRTL